jgi:osmoprotectant transport system substrate-binding protein
MIGTVPSRPVRRLSGLLVCLLTVLVLAGCRSAGRTGGAGSESPGPAVVVASFNFPESALLAEIYSQALQHAGVPVRRELDLGPRELVLPALHQGLVDVVPEYVGTALTSVAPQVGAGRGTAAATAELGRVLARWGVRVLRPSTAQDQNGFVVTRATAQRLRLRSLSDLARVASRLTLGGPAECPRRPYCLLGLQQRYGARFGHFLAFDSQDQRDAALDQRVIDVEVMFTTDGRLATGDLVLLADDRHLQPAENIVPVVTARAVQRYGTRLTEALDAVSARLDRRSLLVLNWRVAVAGKDVAGEARGWLRRHGLLAGPGAAARPD